MSERGAEDAPLVAAAQQGDGTAFGELYERWFDRVHDVSRRIVRDPEVAAEVTQDVFLVAWRQLGSLHRPESFGGWLLRTARNRSLNRLERERRSVALGDEVTVMEIDDRAPARDLPAEQFDLAEQEELVWAAASALGDRDASILHLHLRHGLDGAELAEELDVTPNAANQAMFRLRNRLGGSVRAWVLWRHGEPVCDGLHDALDAAGIDSFGSTAVRTITAHAEDCARCSRHRDALVAPEALFASVPIVATPVGLKARIAGALEAEGVPISATSPAPGSPAPGSPTPGSPAPGSPTPESSTPEPPDPSVSGATPPGDDATIVGPEAGGSGAGASPPGDDATMSLPAPDGGGGDDGADTRRVRRLVVAALVLVLVGSGLWLASLLDGDGDAELANVAPDGSGPADAAPGSTVVDLGVSTTGEDSTTTEATTTTSSTTSSTTSTTASITTSSTTSTTSTTTSTTSTSAPPVPSVRSFTGTRSRATEPPWGSCRDLSERIILEWDTTDALWVLIDGPGTPSGRQPADGSIVVCHPDDAVYTLVAEGPGGTSPTATTGVPRR